jgi:3-hydroxybutyryl-CoA dehydrogenase
MTKHELTIGIVGEGKMGTNLFYYLLDFGFRLVWICHPSADINKIKKTFEKKIKRSFENGILNEQQLTFLQNNILISDDPAALSACNMVIEAIPENLGLKKDLFSKLDTIASPDCILATNSSSILPSELVPSKERADKVVGIHFFYPIALKNIVEFIITETTTGKTRDFVKDFLLTIKRNSLRLKEKNSFILNKIFLDFQNEAYLIVRENHLNFAQMDAIVRANFFPVGVFEFFDSVGIDTMLTSVRNYIRDYPHRDYYSPLTEKLEQMVNEGKLGQKTQSGFYAYPRENEDMNDAYLKDTSNHPLIEETIKRLNFSYFSSAKRYTVHSGCTTDEINNAMKEYFGIDKGPFTS